MIHPVNVELRAHRGVPFVDVTGFEGVDYTGAAFTLEVRRYPDAPGAPLFALAAASRPDAQGVTVTVEDRDGVPVSFVQSRVSETTLEAIRKSSPRGGDVVLHYALDVTGGGLGKHRRMQGAFILEASANG